uniref:Uncharacterized protein n=1 Tax=Rhizophora mucronata TaxID=61149 RepID=A0A2P2QQ86_RHIMU
MFYGIEYSCIEDDTDVFVFCSLFSIPQTIGNCVSGKSCYLILKNLVKILCYVGWWSCSFP